MGEITDLLDEAQQTGDETDLLMEFQNLLNSGSGFRSEIQRVVDEINRMKKLSNFANIANTLKQEGLAILSILDDCITSLDDHAEFLNWGTGA
nr:hypothetical protein 7 [bacterium]